MTWRSGITGTLRDKHAILTGAASGIGRATAELFAAQGAMVTLADVDEPGLTSVCSAIEAAGGRAVGVVTDVGRSDDVVRLVSRGLEAFGPPSVVFSNAASYAKGAADELSEADWDRTLGVCLKATWLLAHETMPLMRPLGGSFIITTSVHAIRGYRRHAAYQAAKGGLAALTRALAADHAPAVRVNSIVPGAVVTGLWKHLSDEDKARNAARCPLQRNASPEEVAWVALFLASDMSSYITAESIVVDGGLTAISGM